jgi:hypothetical protein
MCRGLKQKHLPAVLWIQIRDPVPFWPLDPGSGMGKKSGSGSGMHNPDHILESLETNFVGIKQFFYAVPGSAIWDGKNSDPGWTKSSKK